MVVFYLTLDHDGRHAIDDLKALPLEDSLKDALVDQPLNLNAQPKESQNELNIKLLKEINEDLNDVANHLDETFSDPLFHFENTDASAEKVFTESLALKKENVIPGIKENREEVPIISKKPPAPIAVLKYKETTVHTICNAVEQPKLPNYTHTSSAKSSFGSIKDFCKSTSNYDYYKSKEKEKEKHKSSVPKLHSHMPQNIYSYTTKQRLMRDYGGTYGFRYPTVKNYSFKCTHIAIGQYTGNRKVNYLSILAMLSFEQVLSNSPRKVSWVASRSFFSASISLFILFIMSLSISSMASSVSSRLFLSSSIRPCSFLTSSLIFLATSPLVSSFSSASILTASFSLGMSFSMQSFTYVTLSFLSFALFISSERSSFALSSMRDSSLRSVSTLRRLSVSILSMTLASRSLISLSQCV
eukprot:TRINITY_DN4449_c0_g2_i1.p1 TRINITY_DN4449_c0_g2~~TRINITY_DN4449_c0_g2_i1.p1  ORF type:complete len:414 (-),score=17.83 TRINITY_DN4449_c0_g2_i1:483-1724(-)